MTLLSGQRNDTPNRWMAVRYGPPSQGSAFARHGMGLGGYRIAYLVELVD